MASAQTFVPYGSPYTLPIPKNATPSAVKTVPGVNYPDVSSGGLMTLANATTNFALRFVGEGSCYERRVSTYHEGVWPTHSLTRGCCYMYTCTSAGCCESSSSMGMRLLSGRLGCRAES